MRRHTQFRQPAVQGGPADPEDLGHLGHRRLLPDHLPGLLQGRRAQRSGPATEATTRPSRGQPGEGALLDEFPFEAGKGSPDAMEACAKRTDLPIVVT